MCLGLLGCKDVSNTSVMEKKNSTSHTSIPSYDFDQLTAEVFSKQNDTTYVVNFWATWCKPCVEELPAFEKLQATYATSNPVKVVLVSLDFPQKVESQVIPFIEKHQIQSQVILLDDADANGWIPKVDTTWSGAIPATLIFDKNVKQFYERSFTYEQLETELKPFLKTTL